MTMTHATAAPAWQAGFTERRIYVRRLVETKDGEIKEVSKPLDLFYVILHRGEGECIPFCVCWPKGRLTFSDSRECRTGTAGSAGLWGTRPPSQAGKRRSLTPTAWVAEVSRLIGGERAWEIVRSLGGGKPRL
jgi:hypothetical protein